MLILQAQGLSNLQVLEVSFPWAPDVREQQQDTGDLMSCVWQGWANQAQERADQAKERAGLTALAHAASYPPFWTWSIDLGQCECLPVILLAQVQIAPLQFLGFTLGQMSSYLRETSR